MQNLTRIRSFFQVALGFLVISEVFMVRTTFMRSFKAIEESKETFSNAFSNFFQLRSPLTKLRIKGSYFWPIVSLNSFH